MRQSVKALTVSAGLAALVAASGGSCLVGAAAAEDQPAMKVEVTEAKAEVEIKPHQVGPEPVQEEAQASSAIRLTEPEPRPAAEPAAPKPAKPAPSGPAPSGPALTRPSAEPAAPKPAPRPSAEAPAPAAAHPARKARPRVERRRDEGDLELTQATDKKLVRPGGKVTFTIEIKNPGKLPIKGAQISDDLSDVLVTGKYGGDALADAGEVTFKDKSLKWTGEIPAGGKVKITFSVKAGHPRNGQVKLTGVLSRVDGQGRGLAPAASPGREIRVHRADDPIKTEVGIMDIEVTHTVTPTTQRPGKQVDYTVNVTALPPYPAEDAEVTVDLSKILGQVDGVRNIKADTGTVRRAGDKLVWTGSLPLNGKAAITFSAGIRKPHHGDYILVTQAGDNYIACSRKKYRDCRTQVLIPGLVAVKSVKGGKIRVGDQVPYAITLVNPGRAATGKVTVTDTLSGVLDDASKITKLHASTGTLIRQGGTLVWTGDVTPGKPVKLSYEATIKKGGDRRLRNTVTADMGNCEPPGSDPKCSTTQKISRPKPVEPPTHPVQPVALIVDKLPITGGEFGLMALGAAGLMTAGAALRFSLRRRGSTE